MDDKRIIQLFFSRAEQAIDAVAHKYGRQLFRIALNILSSNADADECVNDTYLALWNTIPPAQPDPLSAYAYRIGRNTALKRLRSNRASKRCSTYDVSLDEIAGLIPDNTSWDTLDAKELGQAIDRFLDTQTKDNRVLFLRRYWFGDSIRDIAAFLHIKESAATVRLSRIRSALKDYLIQEGYVL